MGGNALKNAKTRRYPRHEYIQIEKEVISILKEQGLVQRIHVPRYFNEKKNFGDLDIVYMSSLRNDLFKKRVIELFQPTEVVSHAEVFHLDYKEFQIDFMHCEDDSSWEVKCASLDYGYFTMIIGAMLRDKRIKFNCTGLHLRRERTPTGIVIGDFNLCRNVRKIFSYLNIDYNIFQIGYSTEEEMFGELVKCRFFDPKQFQKLEVEPKNYELHCTISKRPGYMKYFEFYKELGTGTIGEKTEPGSIICNERNHEECIVGLRKKWKDELLDFFGRRSDYEACFEVAENKNASNQLNRRLRSMMGTKTRLIGPDLGKAIAAFKAAKESLCLQVDRFPGGSFTPFEAYLLTLDDYDELEKAVDSFINEHNLNVLDENVSEVGGQLDSRKLYWTALSLLALGTVAGACIYGCEHRYFQTRYLTLELLHYFNLFQFHAPLTDRF